MVDYAPFEPFDNFVKTVKPKKPSAQTFLQNENERTECNYLVMFFIVGVFLLAFGDSTR